MATASRAAASSATTSRAFSASVRADRLRQWLGHRLEHVAGDDRLLARGRGDRDEPAPLRIAAAAPSAAAPVLPSEPGHQEQMAVGPLCAAAGRGVKVRGDVARLEEKRRDAARDLGLRNADRDHAHAPGRAHRPGAASEPRLSPRERQGHARPDRSPGGRAAVGEAVPEGMSSATTGRPLALTSSIARATSPPGAPREPVPRSASITDGAPRQRGGDRPVVLESQGRMPVRPQGLELEPGVAADLGRGAREAAPTGAAPRRLSQRATTKPSPPLPPLPQTTTTQRAATLGAPSAGSAAAMASRGAATGVLHEGGSGIPRLGDRAPVERAHLLGGEDAQHGCYGPGGSGNAWTEEVGEDRRVRLPPLDARGPGSSMCKACRGSRRMPARLAPVAA